MKERSILQVCHTCVFRMCGYNKNYMKESIAEKTQGSQKLLHWSANDVTQWLRDIDLDEYAAGIDRTGIHGAVMVSHDSSMWLGLRQPAMYVL